MSRSRAIWLFDTTHMCLWAEEVAREAGIPAEVVPAPPDRHEARCDLALETLRGEIDRLRRRLKAAGVEFYPPGAPEDAARSGG